MLFINCFFKRTTFQIQGMLEKFHLECAKASVIFTVCTKNPQLRSVVQKAIPHVVVFCFQGAKLSCKFGLEP